jgi:hypothetical protein
MNKITCIVLLLLASFSVQAQKKEKLKGSKIVAIEQKQTEHFTDLEVTDDIEVSLIKGVVHGVELEADDNLMGALGMSMNGGTLILSAAQEISGYKKFSIRVTYTDELKSVTARSKSQVTALEQVALDEITFRAYNEAKLYLNVGAKAVSLILDDKAKAEVNSKAEATTIELSKNAEVKALVASTLFKCDLYQKSSATIEGDVIDFKLRMDNNTSFTGKKLTAKNVDLVAEGYATCNVFAETLINIEASGHSEVDLYGEPGVTNLKKFTGTANLRKRQ